ncbi:hypothetical protein FZD47_25325 [Bacillus infantis]|uniref:Phage virion morphogenesis protein n=1 Tax=Bacillus infantis TaxID=324767 RepID=A0A5D4S1K8_9BACI|nr:hypothetical protein [Bacillus infantis]TYS55752.1 hypothetical protein FZD47_25325 [Bacillus infantis]
MDDLSNIARNLYRMSNRLSDGLADGVEKTAGRVRDTAKGKLGDYQDGWPTLKDRTVAQKMKKNKKAAKKHKQKHGGLVATGTSADAPLIDSGQLRASIRIEMNRAALSARVGSSVIHAATHEFGDDERGIPERPHLRPSLKEETDKHLISDLREGVRRRVGF